MTTAQWIGMAVLGAWCLAGGAMAAADEPRKSAAQTESKADVKAGSDAERKININAASKTELMKLEGVGAGVAQKIIAHRQAHGPFKRPQDLAKVEGVGKGVLEKNAARITVK